MAEFMERLHDRIGYREQEQRFSRQNAVGDIGGELRPMLAPKNAAIDEEREIDRDADDREERPDQRESCAEEIVRVQQRNPQRQRIHEAHHQLSLTLATAAVRQFFEERRCIAVEHIGGMQLAEQANDLVLGQDIILQPRAGDVPDLLNGAFAVHEADDEVGLGRETMQAARRAILEDVPELPAKLMAMNARMGPQPGPHIGNPVPRRAMKRLVHAYA
ncbi:hypothetical protein JQ544_26835 [Bradyrhizobium diazoefficiens]|nr:hypothetical protein [Bradyrhizobium diazoefficiens]MBR0815175.1 hypothetical protein [Bradyrhizobium diazoefficiens]